MSDITKSRFAMIAGSCFLAIAPFFRWGTPSGHDFEFHMNSWMEVLAQWQRGIPYPHWAELAHWGYGEARFVFYPPLSWVFGAALGAVLPWAMVPAAYCWLVLTAAGVAMYRLAREWLLPEEALFAAVFYALNPYHLLIIYWRSAYAELLASVLLPYLLLCLLSLRNFSAKAVLSLSLVVALAWLANIPAALMITYSIVGLVLLWVARDLLIKRSWNPGAWSRLLGVAFAILLGVGLASFYVLPAIYEQRWINIAEVLSLGVRPQDNFLFTRLADPDHNRFNLLISIVSIAEIVILVLAIVFSRQKGSITASGPRHSVAQHARFFGIAMGVGSAFLLTNASNPLWQHLPKLRFVQLPFRWLLCLNAALTLLLPLATPRRTLPSRILRAATWAALLATLFIAGYYTQPPWWELAADIQEMHDAIADGSGYEGTDEYVPAGVDAYNVDQNLPLVTDETGAPIPVQTLAWGAAGKHFKLHTGLPEQITIRLFNYPAWEVPVNGRPVRTRTSEDIGLMQIPIAAGDNDISIHFRQTPDRLAGIVLSLVSLTLLVVLQRKSKWLDRWLTQTVSPAA